MSSLAHWIRYFPADFARGRDYRFDTFGHAPPDAALDGFLPQAGRALDAVGVGHDPVWQFADVSASAAVLSRGSYRRIGREQSAEVWGLLIPIDWLSSARVSLQACAAAFPASEQASPVPLDLRRLPLPAQPSPATRLIANAYLNGRVMRLPVSPPDVLLRSFSDVLDQLPPADRRGLSFSSAPLGLRSFEPRSDGLAAVKEHPQSDYDRIALWHALAPALDEAQRAMLSLRGSLQPSLAALIEAGDPAASYARMAPSLTGGLDTALREPVLDVLRTSLERALQNLPRATAATAVARLGAGGYFDEENGAPPLWLARIAVDSRLLPLLPRNALRRVFRAAAVPLLLGSIRRGGLPRLGALVEAAGRAPAPTDTQSSELRQICLQLCQQRPAAPFDFAYATALLSLSRHALSTSASESV